MTLKNRVDEFWKWYAQHAEEFLVTIDDKRCSDLQPEVSAAVDRWLPGMAWVFGPGEDKNGHSFTLSGEGVVAKQFAAEYCIKRAPKLDGWTFYPARQPSPDVRSFSLEFDGKHSFEPKELWLRLLPNEDDEKIDIVAWHPLYEKIPDTAKYSSLFLLLDEALGEHGTQNWIGEIKIADTALKDAVPIWEMPEFIKQIEMERGWKKYKPTDTYTSYQRHEPKDGLRSDIFVGTARCMSLVREYWREEGPVEHPVPDLGMDFIFVAFPSEILPKGEEVAFRTSIEDDIVMSFDCNSSGEALGGAMGRKHAYIDLALFDGKSAIEQILAILKKHGLPRGTAIHYFTKEKAGMTYRL